MGGVIVTIVVGVVGGVLGGWLFSLFGAATDTGILGSIITATIGAVILLFIVSKFGKSA
jgi:uncharacterized membrane protein YeaQ/YmgE (transglycosylase-associated protein family)